MIVLLLIGLGIRLWWLLNVNTQPVTDFDFYYERAKDIAANRGYAVDGVFTAYWPVGYPFFLSLFFRIFGPSILLAKILNTALTLSCVGLTYWITWRLWNSAIIGFLAGLVLALAPPFVAYSGIVASEPLYTALMLLAVAWSLVACQRPKFWLLVGVAVGFATLVRPQAVLIPFLIIPGVALFSRSEREDRRLNYKKAFIYSLATMFLIQLPWHIRNLVVFKSPVFISTNGGDNLWIGNNKDATGKYMPPPGIPQSPEKELANDKATRTEGKNYILDYPGRVISLWPEKLAATFLTRSDVAYWSFQTEKGKLISPGTGDDKPLYKFTQRFSASYSYWLLILSALGALLSFPILESRRAIAIPVAMIALTALLSIIFFGNPRFGFPAIPFQAMLAAGAVGSAFMFLSLPLAWWQDKKSPPGRLE